MTQHIENYVHFYMGTVAACGIPMDQQQIVGRNAPTEMLGHNSRIMSTVNPGNVTCFKCNKIVKREGIEPYCPFNLAAWEENVLQWAKEKGILDKATPQTQFIKTIEEVGELATGLNRLDGAEIQDAIGDIIVTLTIQARMQGMCLEDCLDQAWSQIKGRQGKIENGVFVKGQK